MGQKCEGNCGLWALNEILKKTYPKKPFRTEKPSIINFRYVKEVWASGLLGVKNPQTTMALTFLTHIISDIGGVTYEEKSINIVIFLNQLS